MNYEDDAGPPMPPLDVKVNASIPVEHIAGLVSLQVREQARASIDKAIEEAVEEAIRDATAERIAKAVAEVIASGFEQRDEYGRELPKATLRDKVIEAIRNGRDSWDRKSTIQRAVDDQMRSEVEKMAKEEVEAARLKFREQVDALLAAKFGDTLRQALGVKS